MRTPTINQLINRPKVSHIDILHQDLVKLIDNTIISQNTNGFNKAQFELPVSFESNGLSQLDAQLILFGRIIKTYKEKGFKDDDIKIVYNKGKPFIEISWNSGLSEEERLEYKQLLSKHMAKR